MKIVALNGALPSYNYGLGRANKLIFNILSELGVTVDEVNLPISQIPYYDGIKSKFVDNLIKTIKTSNGVIFSTVVSPYSTGASIQVLAEYLEYENYNKALIDKNCFVLVVSKNGGMKMALDYFSNMINSCGGFDSVRVCLNSDYLEGDEIHPYAKDILEKQVEDYYRIVRQNRKFIIPDYNTNKVVVQNEFDSLPTSPLNKELSNKQIKQKMTLSDIYNKLDLDSFNEEQERDINEITNLFANKYDAQLEQKRKTVKVKKAHNIFNEELTSQNAVISPREKTCKQLTNSLPHYFQPQLATGLTQVIQLIISGEENFEGYIIIEDSECEYYAGKTNNPDITIIADSSVWSDILKGKITAQKAFMIGQLKVIGNFIVLTKFEQLFKTV